MASTILLDELASPYLPEPVPYAVLEPESGAPLPLCLLLLGAGGTRDNLTALQPVFDGWWKEGVLPLMTVVTPTPGPDYYVEDPDGKARWDSFFTRALIPCFRRPIAVAAGISGGGYGILKLAFGAPQLFKAVAAMQPMLEPGLRESDVRARNRLHHAAGGSVPGGALWEANNPANRARANSHAIRESGMAIYVEAAENDFLNAHDGAEFLHRQLWDLDLSHEYRLVRGGDHGGPTMRPRLRAMFAWLGSVLNPPVPDAAIEQAAKEWLESGMTDKPPAGATTTQAFLDAMRSRFEPLRAQAAETDPAARRRFGVL